MMPVRSLPAVQWMRMGVGGSEASCAKIVWKGRLGWSLAEPAVMMALYAWRRLYERGGHSQLIKGQNQLPARFGTAHPGPKFWL